MIVDRRSDYVTGRRDWALGDNPVNLLGLRQIVIDTGRLVIMKKFQVLLLAVIIAAANTGFCTASLPSSSSPDMEALRPLLNSERIQWLFGSYFIDVLKNNPTTRVSNLYSKTAGISTTRTIAVVNYPTFIDPAFAKEHQLIIAGQSLGAVFKRNGWNIEKRHIYFGSIQPSRRFDGVYGLMGEIAPTTLAIHSYDFVISKHGRVFRYAGISEVHHPDYLSLQMLAALYADDFADKQTVNDDIRRRLMTVEKALAAI